MRKDRLWTRTFISVSLVNFVMILSMYILLVTMAAYAMETFQASAGIAGLVASIFILGILFGRLFAGNQTEKMGTKKILIIGTSSFLILSLLYYVDIGIYGLIVVRIFQGIGLGFATTATGTIVAQVIPSSRSGEGIGYFSMSAVLATAIGPLIGIALINTTGYQGIFVFSTVVATITFILALSIKPPTISYQVEVEPTSKQLFKFSNFFEPKAIPISVTILVAAFAYSGILSFITTYADEINLTKASGYYFLVYSIVILLSRPFTGKLMDIRGANTVAYPAIISFAIGMFLISQAQSSFAFLLGAVFIGLGYGNLQSITQALAIKSTPLHRMGLANSTYFIFLDLALGLGPLFLGMFIPTMGYRGVYLALVAIIIFTLPVYFLMHGRKDKQFMEEQYSQNNS